MATEEKGEQCLVMRRQVDLGTIDKTVYSFRHRAWRERATLYTPMPWAGERGGGIKRHHPRRNPFFLPLRTWKSFSNLGWKPVFVYLIQLAGQVSTSQFSTATSTTVIAWQGVPCPEAGRIR